MIPCFEQPSLSIGPVTNYAFGAVTALPVLVASGSPGGERSRMA